MAAWYNEAHFYGEEGGGWRLGEGWAVRGLSKGNEMVRSWFTVRGRQ